jgi:ComEC/Rec2-related protein
MSHIQKYCKPLFAVPGIGAGILLYYSPSTGAIATIMIIGAIAGYAYRSKEARLDALAIILIWTCIGWSAAYLETRPFYNLYPADQQTKLTLLGTVTDYSYCAHIRYPHRLTIALEQITRDSTKTPFDGSVHIYTNHRSSEQPFALGTRLNIATIKLRKPQEKFARYLIKEGLLGSLFAEHNTITIIDTPYSFNCSLWLHEKRTVLLDCITDKLTPHQAALFGALFVGNKTSYKKEVETIQTQFRYWGVSHIFARSGMHISLIIGIILYLLFLIPMPYNAKIVCATLIGLLYALLSWPTISFTRALIMFLWTNYCILARRYSSTLHLLGITTMLVLLWHPLNLFFLDFQLSFALTGALIWICTQIAKKSKKGAGLPCPPSRPS